MSTTIFYRFVVKRDTRANFVAANTLLLEGEWSLELDTGRMKIGDGVTAYNALKFHGFGVGVLTDGATITIDASLGDSWRVTLGGNRTLANPTNLIDGQVLNVRIKQDATGGRTLAYGSKWKFPDGTAPVLSTGAAAQDFLSAQYDATDDTLLAVVNKAFA